MLACDVGVGFILVLFGLPLAKQLRYSCSCIHPPLLSGPIPFDPFEFTAAVEATLGHFWEQK